MAYKNLQKDYLDLRDPLKGQERIEAKLKEKSYLKDFLEEVIET